MKNRRILIVALVLCLLTTAGGAEALYTKLEQSYLDASAALQEWISAVDEQKNILTDDESQIILNMCRNALMTYQTVLLESAEPQKVVQEIQGDMIPREGEYVLLENGEHCSTPICWIAEISVYLSCDVYYRQDYVRAQYTLYNEKGEYIGSLVANAGKKEEETIFLIVDYDNLSHMTGRFALRISEEQGNVIFTKTLGEHLNVRLDVDSWQAGEELGEWSKDLLLPATVL